MAFSIVIIDTDAGSGQITQAGIQRAFGLDAMVTLASAPNWTLFHEQQPDSIIFDPATHSWDGVRVIQRIHEELPKTHVVVLASEPSPVLRATMQTLGDAAYIEKPAPVSVVVEQLRRILTHPSLSELMTQKGYSYGTLHTRSA